MSLNERRGQAIDLGTLAAPGAIQTDPATQPLKDYDYVEIVVIADDAASFEISTSYDATNYPIKTDSAGATVQSIAAAGAFPYRVQMDGADELKINVTAMTGSSFQALLYPFSEGNR